MPVLFAENADAYFLMVLLSSDLNHFPAEENHALFQQSYHKRTSVSIIHKEPKMKI